VALVLADRVQQTGTANTTVSFTLSGSVTGFKSFTAGVGNGNTTYYAATDTSGNWETGLGTFSTTGPTLTRTTVYESSNSNLAVTFSGTVTVFVSYVASRAVFEDSAGNLVITPSNFESQTANTALAAPDGSNGVPTFRNLQLTDLPDAWTKKSAKASSPSNLTLSGAQTIDGISCVAGDRVLVRAQTTTSQNGIYTVQTGAWTRTADADTASKIAGAVINVDQGTVSGGVHYDTDFKSTDTLGSTTMGWNRIVDTGYFTVVGNNLATLTSPSALTFPRFNADNTVTAVAPTGTGSVVLADAPTLTGTTTVATFSPSLMADAGALARNAGKTANTTINATTTYTTGGLTLASQTAAVGSSWYIRAFGQYTAASSGTARTARVACFWGSTQLTAITPTVLTSTAQTTQWQCEFTLTASSTTAIWTAGTIIGRTASATALAIDNATPASTTVTAGAQTLDLRFSMSSAGPADSWIVQSVTMQRVE
jgi:hypothetical protein